MNVNINAYNRLTGKPLYNPNISLSNFVNKKYYVKKVYYGNYVKNIVLPLECINSFGKGNLTGIKNTGKNEIKLLNSRIRSQSSCIRKAYENFAGCKNIGFTTLTYAKNQQDLKQANYEFKLFIQKIKRHFAKYKKNTYKNLKYLVTYEYQTRGAIHFHIIFSKFISKEIIRKFWKYGFEKTLPVKTGTYEFVCKYVAKYIVKSITNTEKQKQELAKEFNLDYKPKKSVNKNKQKNLYDLNMKAYRFSGNCQNPRIKVGVIEMCEMELLASLKGTRHKFLFGDNQGYMIGLSVDSDWNEDYFWQMEEYVPFYKKQWRHRKKIIMNIGKQRYIKKVPFLWMILLAWYRPRTTYTTILIKTKKKKKASWVLNL